MTHLEPGLLSPLHWRGHTERHCPRAGDWRSGPRLCAPATTPPTVCGRHSTLRGVLWIWEGEARAGKGQLSSLPQTEMRCTLPGRTLASGQRNEGRLDSTSARSLCMFSRNDATCSVHSHSALCLFLNTFQTKTLFSLSPK